MIHPTGLESVPEMDGRKNGDDDSDGFDEERSNDPDASRSFCLSCVPGAVKLLVHTLNAQQEEHCGKAHREDFQGRIVCKRRIKNSHVCFRQDSVHLAETTSSQDNHRRGNNHGSQDDDAVRKIRVGDGHHAADHRKDRHEQKSKEHPLFRRYRTVRNRIQDVPACLELVADDRCEADDDGYCPEKPGHRTVPDFQDIADSVLPERPDLGGQKINDDDAHADASHLPHRAPPGFGRELSA